MNFFKKLLCFSQKEQKSENVYSHENEDPEEIIFAELPFPLEQEDLIIGILNQIACEKNKPVEKINVSGKYLMLLSLGIHTIMLAVVLNVVHWS
jgi:hypothetical protein